MRQLPVSIYVYTFCYNNAQVLPYIIDYWYKYAAKVIVYDNESIDNSRNILSKYDWIEVRSYNTDNKYNPDKIQSIKNQCYKEAAGIADYVMVCDIDEILFVNDKLFQYLADCKKMNVTYFVSKYYECISRNMPDYYPQKLLQNICKAIIDQKIQKVLLFDPSINITFSNYQHTYNIINKDNLQPATIITLHAKMIGISYMNERQNLYINRISNNTNLQYALKYGTNPGNISSYFNYSFSKIYTSSNVLNLAATNILPEKLQTRQNTPEKFVNFGSCKFFDLKWKNTAINYTNDTKNRNCVIMVPVFKTKLTDNEVASLLQVYNILGSKYNIILVGPESLDFNIYKNIVNKNINTLKCNSEYFKNIKTYSYLCETYQFYQCFNDYNFMLLYQLDGWIFKDDIRKFIMLDYDYVGAPWLNNSLAPDCHVGNGGVSFRKISKFIDICKNVDKKYLNNQQLTYYEDQFFCSTCKKLFKDDFEIPGMDVASTFSLDGNDEYWVNKNNGKLPMCLHKWEYKSYWKDKVINSEIQKQIKEYKDRENMAIKQVQKTNNIKVALCAIAKNENLYIREWVEWYKNIGIDKIFLYDNNDLDGEHFEEVINDYIQSNYVQIINKRGIEKGLVYDKDGVNLQPACYCECYETYGKNFDWMCFFDIDEFINLKNHYNTLQDFIKNEKFNKFDTILVPWQTYDDNDKLIYENKPVVERFTRVSSIYKKYIVKTIVRTKQKLYKDKTINCLIHCFLTDNETICNVNGEKIKNNKSNWYLYKSFEFKNATVVLNHYKTKSIEEFFSRQLGRHWGTGKTYTNIPIDINKCIENFYTVNNKTTQKEDFIKNNYIQQSNIVDVYMASIWRSGHVINSIKSIINQKEVKTLTLSANNFTQEQIQMVKDQIMNNKLIIKETQNEKCSMEKLRFVSEGTAEYIAFCDDDLIYCPNYFKILIENCEKLNAAVSMHGSILPKQLPIKSYYKDKKTLPYMDKINETTKVDILGNGVSLFKRSFLTKQQYIDLYEKAPNISMDDITVSYELRKSKHDIYVLKHNGKEVISKKSETTDKSTYLQYKNNCLIQTNWINENFKNLK